MRSWQIYATVSRPALDAARAALGDKLAYLQVCSDTSCVTFSEVPLEAEGPMSVSAPETVHAVRAVYLSYDPDTGEVDYRVVIVGARP